MITLAAALGAIPAGLGHLPDGPARAAAGGVDVRARLRRWLSGAGDATAAVPADPGMRLVDLLPGLEWSEAMLVINSFEPPLLAALCPAEPEEDAENGDGQDHEGEHHGHGGDGASA
jgi:hypothetical protein